MTRHGAAADAWFISWTTAPAVDCTFFDEAQASPGGGLRPDPAAGPRPHPAHGAAGDRHPGRRARTSPGRRPSNPRTLWGSRPAAPPTTEQGLGHTRRLREHWHLENGAAPTRQSPAKAGTP
ncbi:hypothetical protein QJS66_01955 [Kocuria rhizophila]|nr:hypothetical protein QJS66_01955 [Kocuria rhizophila]